MVKLRNQKFSIHLHHIRHEQYCSDPLRLRQIFINILSNASKFTPDDGEITFDIEEFATDQPDTVWLEFTIADNGIGMGSDYLKHLFDPFSRELDSRVDKTEGSGLGMAITHRLTDLLGGLIDVKSTLGKGTTFHVSLPLEIDDAPPLPAALPGLHILVVDDDVLMCEYVAETLQNLGVKTTLCSSGQQALDRIDEVYQAGKHFDAVFLDWKMPGLDGQETARRIRSRVSAQLPILIVSAYDWSDIREQAQDAGITGFISKPLFVSTLYRALQIYVLGQAENQDSPDETDSTLFAGRRFLLVEDNELNREIATELLENTGAEVENAENGQEGVWKIEHAPAHWYDLILMDIQMPVMNGYQAARRIRALPRSDTETIPILALTADAFAEDIALAAEAGMNGHLSKPLNLSSLKREIQKQLRIKETD